ncbi:MAG: CbiQ family ECF transporter T component [candidate division WOR-3 bacterium]
MLKTTRSEAISKPAAESHLPTPLGRILTFLLCTPGLFAINRYQEVAASLALILYLYIITFPRSVPKTAEGFRNNTSLSSLRTFLWLAPSIILANALLGPSPKIIFFSLTGAWTGFILSYRLIWASSLALLLISSCPPEELLFALQRTLKPSRLFKNLPVILTLTLQLIPHFTDIRVRDIHHLPEAIDQRLTAAQKDIESKIVHLTIASIDSSPPPLIKPYDFLLLGPALAFALFVILCR